LLPAKPDPPLTACFQRSQIIREVRVRITLRPACSLRSQIHCYRRSHFHPYGRSQIPCYQRSQIVREVRVIIPLPPASSQRNQIHCYQRSQIHHYQLAPSEATFTPTTEARSTANSLLPAKPDCLRCESESPTTTSFLPVKPDPLLSVKPDPPLIACSQQS